MSSVVGEHNYSSQSFTTETGLQAVIPVNATHEVLVVINGNASSDDIDLEIILDDPTDSPTRHKLAQDVISSSAPYIKKIDGPVRGVAIDIDANVSNDISVQVLTAPRGR